MNYFVIVNLAFDLSPPSNECQVKVVQSCPTLCDPMDYTDHGIL